MSWPDAFAFVGAVIGALGFPSALIAFRMHTVRTCEHDWVRIYDPRSTGTRPIAHRCLKCGVER